MRFWWTRGKNDVFLFLLLSFMGLFTIGAGAYLGNVYLHLLQAPDDTRPVFGPVDKTPASTTPLLTASLPPVRVYYVQTGVYTLRESAVNAQTDLENLGYAACVEGQGPFRVIAGVYGDRPPAARLAAALEKSKVNSYVATVVLNDSALEYSTGQKKNMEKILPLLQLYGGYLAKAASLSDYPFNPEAKNEFQQTLREMTGSYNSIEKQQGALSQSARNLIKDDFFNYLGAYQTVAEALPDHWEADNYYSLHVSLAELVENYGRLVNNLKLAVKETQG